MKAVLSTCPFCSSGCGLYFLESDGGLVGVAPSENHPVSEGRLCARGWFAHEAPTWGERLTRPLVRRGERLEAASWDEALGQAASGLRTTADAGGGVGALGSARATSEESYLTARLARAGLQTPHLDSALRAGYQPLLDGLGDVGGPAAVAGTLGDLERCQAVLVVEGDLARTHPRVAFSVMRAVRSGARLVTLGWTRTPLARLSALQLPLAPNCEREVLAGLAAAAMAGAHAADVPGAEALRERLASRRPSDAERRVAEWFRDARQAAVLIAPLGLPPPETRGVGQALARFAALTGHLGRAGSVLLPLPALANLRGACEAGVTPDRWPGGWPLGDAGARERLRSLWQREPCAESGMDAAAMLGALSGLVALADEALAALPSGRAALDALANLRCLVVLGAFATPMSQLAHVVLPIASPVETEGRVLNLEGRVLEWHAALPPPGQARPGWRVLADLGQRLGCPDPYRSLADVRQELRDALAGSSSAVRVAPRDLEPAREGPAEPACVLVRDGVYDWSSDPLVQGSPMLRRDFDSRRKRFPLGLVELCPHDAEGLGLRQGGSVRLRSSQGEAVAPVVLRPELEPGVALVPFAFRDPLAALLGTRGRMEVRLTRA